MIKTARQLKDLIRNLSREKSADAQILWNTIQPCKTSGRHTAKNSLMLLRWNGM